MLRYYYRVRRGSPRTIVSDVCVYGGTSAGIAAAVIARRLGRSVSVAAVATVPSAAAVQDVGVVVCSHSARLGRAVFDGLEVRTSAG